MLTERYKLKFNRHKTLSKVGVLSFLFVLTVGLSARTYYEDPIPTGSFQLVYPANFGNRINVPADNPTTKQGVYLGRLLFYETALSANNKLSCSSCHRQEKAFTDGKALSEGVDHVLSTRNSMSLVNLLWTRKLFWDGRAASLEDQAATPLSNPHEMGQSLTISAQKLSRIQSYPALFRLVYGDTLINGDRIVKSIAQFERTLISANSRYDQYLRNAYQPNEQELKGMALFNQFPQPEKGIRGANCAHCHGGAKTYMELFHNNGLDSIPKDAGIETLTGLPADRGRFKVPTLRNIALTAPYMHDGRFKILEEVIDHYSEHIKQSASLSSFLQGESNEIGGTSLKLLPEEKKELLAFLNMLTDSVFISNPSFSNPHLRITTNK
ncbi:cytochrome-c peroxidase [Mucilaginibacter paludis]|uniref:Di-heme cytochrome c peroxidase n=1 Tax=Mucilaginibacter paludis DSM 18603 TaxID=714943 RepID=H1YHK9_9SPHI|nr:cytochrome c peroxidase [Mucilaginibacter paludis]EHQ26432.1 Di-heme cytochrome c peroxidase [Mucilaginibacter paludis DSM 18603]